LLFGAFVCLRGKKQSVRKLILAKHSLPAIEPDMPAHKWRLSDVGRERCHVLAEQLKVYDPDVIVSSLEPKAIETAHIVADVLGMSFRTARDLHEHDRSNVAFETRERFEQQVAEFFLTPDQLVFGAETADRAHRRFADAVHGLIEEHAEGNLVVVAHGTVITLFVSRVAQIDPYELWKRLGLPSFVGLALPELKVVDEWTMNQQNSK
jgi:broad specificity phosphatase PhoE